MSGGTWLHGEWLAVGSWVEILRDGYVGKRGIFKGKGPNGKLLVNLEGRAVKIHVTPSEIRRAQAIQKTTAGIATQGRNEETPRAAQRPRLRSESDADVEIPENRTK